MKNLFIVMVSVLLLAVSQNTNAQEAEKPNLLQFYENEMLHWNYTKFGTLTLNYRNDTWNYSVFGTNLKNEKIRMALFEYPDSAQAYNSYRKNQINGNILYWSGLALILSSLIPVVVTDNSNLGIGLWAGMLAGGATISTIGIHKFNSAQSNLFNAVDLFNRNKARELNR